MLLCGTYISERGVVYKFQLSARNEIDYGDDAVQTIRTPDGSELLPLDGQDFSLSTTNFQI